MGFGRARTLPAGTGQVSAALEGQTTAPQSGANGNPAPLPWAQVEAGYRRGIVSGFELGARGWLGGLLEHYGAGVGLDAKTQLYRGKKPSGSFDVSLVSAIAYHHVEIGGAPWHTFHAMLPLLVGINAGPHQLVLGPRVGATVWTAEGQDTIKFPWFGSSLGFSAKVGKGFSLFPESVLLYAPLSFNGTSPGDRKGAWELQAALGATYDP
jgi:hypothetical protein